MSNRFYKKIILISVLSIGVFTVSTNLAQASVIEGITTFFGLGFAEMISYVLASLMNALLMIASYLLAMSGWLLNFSIKLTLNIKSFVDSAPAIFTTWKAIRDISGLFIIFFLLYNAIQLILGLTKPKFGETIKNIVMAGIMINFSFFFAGLGIDISNIISIQLYNAIAPANTLTLSSLNTPNTTGLNNTIRQNVDGGISNIFMNSLQIPTLYKANGNSSQALFGNGENKSVFDNIKILLIGVTGVMITIAAAISFAVAAVAFIFRFVILIFLLAFSPIWFLSFLPDVKSYTEKWIGAYKSMLIFMPVYLLLMYLAMNVLTTTPLFKNLSVPSGPPVNVTSGGTANTIIQNVYADQASGAAGSNWYDEYLVLAVNATLVIILLNLPLFAAASVAKTSIPFLDKAAKNFGAGALWSKLGSQAGSRTIGRAGYAAANSDTVKRWVASSPTVGGAIAGGFSKVSGMSFGEKKGDYENRMKEKAKNQEKMHKMLSSVDKSKYAVDKSKYTVDKSKYDLTSEEGKRAFAIAEKDASERLKEAEVISSGKLKAAEARGKNYQAQYRQNLPWKPAVSNLGMGGLIGFMVDNRTNRQTAAKLTKDAGKETDKEAKKEAQKEKSVLKKELDELQEIESGPDIFTGRIGEDAKRARQARIKEIKNKMSELDEAIQKGKEVEDEEKEQNTIKKLEAIEGKLDKSAEGGGDKK